MTSRYLARGLGAVVAGIALAAGGLAGTAVAAPARAGHLASGRTFSDRLYGVAAVSPQDAWAVGLEPSRSLIVHWNGKAWSQSLAGLGFYYGVAAGSASDVWAVGGTYWFRPTHTLIEHWNGTRWARVPSPSPSGGGLLSAAAAISPDDAWAVGYAGPGPGIPSPTVPLIEHWNGTTWTMADFPKPADGGQFKSVTATSATDVWVVGYTGPASEGTNHKTLIEHWNGKTWTRVPSPNAAGGYSSLNGVAAASPDDVWAVGATNFADHQNTLIEHWNGKAWTLVSSPTPTGDAQLEGVSATQRTAWAVGMARPTTCDPRCTTVIEHWNGTSWTQTPSPNAQGNLNILLGVSAIGSTSAWAVGSTDYSATLIAHWNGKTWS
jgi:hypothetical protein